MPFHSEHRTALAPITRGRFGMQTGGNREDVEGCIIWANMPAPLYSVLLGFGANRPSPVQPLVSGIARLFRARVARYRPGWPVWAIPVLGILAAVAPGYSFVTLDTSQDPTVNDTLDAESDPEAHPDSLSGYSSQAGIPLDTSATSAVPAVSDSAKPDTAAASPSSEARRPAQRSEGASAPQEKASSLPHYGTVIYLSARGRETFAVKGFLQTLREYGLAPDLFVAEGHAAWPVAHAARGADWSLLEAQLSEHLLPGESAATGNNAQSPFDGDLAGEDPPQIRISTRGGQWLWENGLEVAGAGEGDPEARALRLSNHLWRLQAESTQLAHCFQARHAATGALGCEGPAPSFHALNASLQTRAAAEAANPPLNWLPIEDPAGRLPHPESWGFTYDRLILLAFSDGVPDIGVQATILTVIQDGDLPDSAGIDAWTERGVRTGLRSMDVLRQWLSPHAWRGTVELPPPPVPVVVPFGSREGSVLRHAVEEAASRGELPHPRTPMLRELSLDWAESPEGAADSQGGAGDGADSRRILYGAEESYLASAASIRLLLHGKRLEREEPEAFLQSEWCEPFYIPFRLGAGVLLGGAQPGYGWHFSLHPLTRMDLALGFFQWKRAWDHESPSRLWREAGAVAFGMRESHIGLGLFFRPLSRVSLAAEVDRIVLEPGVLPLDWDDTPYEALRFQGEAALQSEKNSRFTWSLQGRWRFWDPVELEGPVRDTLWEQTLALNLEYRGWELFARAHTGSLWQAEGDWTVPALGVELPGSTVTDGFRLQESWVAEGWGGGAAYALDVGAMRLKGTLGTTRVLRGTAPGMESESSRFFWELMATYATRLGPLRAGLGAYEKGNPLWVVSLGARADIGAWISRWREPLSRPLGRPGSGK